MLDVGAAFEPDELEIFAPAAFPEAVEPPDAVEPAADEPEPFVAMVAINSPELLTPMSVLARE